MGEASKNPARTPPRLLRVRRMHDLTPHLRRITLAGSALEGFPPDSAGAHIKLMLPQAHQIDPVLPTLGADGPIWPPANERPITRTYTVAAYDAQAGELDVDFVLHGENGPASRWATLARPGDAIGVAGPAAPPRFLPQADFFFLFGDPSAFAVIGASLATLPPDARGMALLEVADASEIYQFPHPPGVQLHWFSREGAPAGNSRLLLEAMQGMPWPEGQVSITLAGESAQVVALRDFFLHERGIAKRAMYAVPYWKDEHTEEAYHQERHRIMDELEEAEEHAAQSAQASIKAATATSQAPQNA